MDYYELLSKVTGLEADYLKLSDDVLLIRPCEAIEAIEMAVKILNIPNSSKSLLDKFGHNEKRNNCRR